MQLVSLSKANSKCLSYKTYFNDHVLDCLTDVCNMLAFGLLYLLLDMFEMFTITEH